MSKPPPQVSGKKTAMENNMNKSIVNDYGEEEEFIKTVEDDILENKYSSDEEAVGKYENINIELI